MSMLSVDATNSEDKVQPSKIPVIGHNLIVQMVNMRLTDGGEDEVVICCDVKVLRYQVTTYKLASSMTFE